MSRWVWAFPVLVTMLGAVVVAEVSAGQSSPRWLQAVTMTSVVMASWAIAILGGRLARSRSAHTALIFKVHRYFDAIGEDQQP